MSERLQRENQQREIVEFFVRVSTRSGMAKSAQDSFLSAGAALPHDANMIRIETAAMSTLRSLITARRETLNILWDLLKAGDDIRSAFRAVTADTCTEETLDLHEQEVARCESLYRQNQPILHLVDTRESMLKEIDDLKLLCGDSARLTDRTVNSSLVRRKEERLKQLLTQELPSVDSTLNAAIVAYEKEHGRFFNVWGSRYLENLYSQDPLHLGDSADGGGGGGGGGGGPPEGSGADGGVGVVRIQYGTSGDGGPSRTGPGEDWRESPAAPRSDTDNSLAAGAAGDGGGRRPGAADRLRDRIEALESMVLSQQRAHDSDRVRIADLEDRLKRLEAVRRDAARDLHLFRERIRVLEDRLPAAATAATAAVEAVTTANLYLTPADSDDGAAAAAAAAAVAAVSQAEVERLRADVDRLVRLFESVGPGPGPGPGPADGGSAGGGSAAMVPWLAKEEPAAAAAEKLWARLEDRLGEAAAEADARLGGTAQLVEDRLAAEARRLRAQTDSVHSALAAVVSVSATKAVLESEVAAARAEAAAATRAMESRLWTRIDELQAALDHLAAWPRLGFDQPDAAGGGGGGGSLRVEEAALRAGPAELSESPSPPPPPPPRLVPTVAASARAAQGGHVE